MSCSNLFIYISVLSLSLTGATYAGELKNTLIKHASPYLAMHGRDPVAWQQWNRESVERAKKEAKLLYVSSGYFSCHWCHVMQRESYQNTMIAKILNEKFIPVKVDREINAALDGRLIDFVERTQGRAGWPLNVFITPEGYPLVGVTYLPAENFKELLNNLSTKWKNERGLLEKIALDATAELEAATKVNQIKQPASENHITLFLAQAKLMADELSGGFGEQNKFPSVPQLSVMLDIYKSNRDKKLKRFLNLTLNNMATQGLYDQVDGGFFRYTIDPAWQTPHFEKMLYDNALLASLYIQAAEILENEYYASIAKQTLDFMLSELRLPHGGFIASLSAVDDKGIEGGYYLWQREELQKHLTDNEFSLVSKIWNLNGIPDLEAGYHLVTAMTLFEAAKKLEYDNDKAEKLFSAAKLKMRALRHKRKLPADDKILAGWNGLALSAFAQAARMYKSDKYADAARKIKKYIHQNLWIDNNLQVAIKNNKSLGYGEFKDYAYVIKGLADWIEYENKQISEDERWLKLLIEQAWEKFYTKKGWRSSKNTLLKYKQSASIIPDDVLPSPSVLLINLTFKYSRNTRMSEQAAEALTLIQPELFEQPFWYASHIYALHGYQKRQ